MPDYLNYPDDEEYRYGEDVPTVRKGHLVACRMRPVYKRGEDVPLLYISRCAKGCQVLQCSLDRGVELADRYGW